MVSSMRSLTGLCSAGSKLRNAHRSTALPLLVTVMQAQPCFMSSNAGQSTRTNASHMAMSIGGILTSIHSRMYLCHPSVPKRGC